MLLALTALLLILTSCALHYSYYNQHHHHQVFSDWNVLSVCQNASNKRLSQFFSREWRLRFEWKHINKKLNFIKCEKVICSATMCCYNRLRKRWRRVKMRSHRKHSEISQIADMPWIADKMFSPKCYNLCWTTSQ